MKIKVIYFTRSNNSRRVAKKLSELLNADLIEITDRKNYKGFFGYIKAGFYSVSNKKVIISLDNELKEYDYLYVVSPIWAGKLANPIRAFLNGVDLKKVNLVTVSIGSTYQSDLYNHIYSITKNDQNEDQVLQEVTESKNNKKAL